MSKSTVFDNLKCPYEVSCPESESNLCRVKNYKLLIVPEYAVNYTVDYCQKNGIKAVLEEDKEVIDKYSYEYDFVILKENKPCDTEDSK